MPESKENGRSLRMRLSAKQVAVLAVVLLAAGAVGYLASTSDSSSANPCRSSSTTAGSSATAASPARTSVLTDTSNGFSPSHRLGLDSSSIHSNEPASSATSGVIPVVAAENFWGSLVGQLGGNRTSVLSIVNDPNTDPHEYETNTSTAVAIANAQFVIVNGVGYDDWALQLVSASVNPHRVVLNVGDLNGVTVSGGIVSGNAHMWYNPAYVNRTVAAMYSALIAISPGDAAYFHHLYAVLNVTLGTLYARATEVQRAYAGTEVASTESIFVYLANFTQLNLVSPPEFMKAVAEGNDPPAQSIVLFQCQLESGHVKILVYNVQTVTPITTQLKQVAAQLNIPVVGVSETIQPPGASFQDWMGGEFSQLQGALSTSTRGP